MNDETKKKPLGKVVVGEAVLLALKRIQRDGLGGLFDKDDIGLLEEDIITAERAPYVFKLREKDADEAGKRIAEDVLVLYETREAPNRGKATAPAIVICVQESCLFSCSI